MRVPLRAALFVVLALPAAAAHATSPFQPGAHGYGHQKVCKAVPSRQARCDAEVVVDAGGQPLVTPAPSGYGPSDLLSAYGLTTQAASAGATQTLAIVDAYDHPSAEADLGVYRSQYGLSPCTTANGCFRKVDQRGGTTYPKADGGWAQEISLDLDMASAICPNCKILLVEADSNAFSDLVAAVDRAAILGATQISNSYGGSEYSGETSDESHYNHPGIAVTVSSGDAGYGAEFPASSRYVTAVGGTNLQPNAGTTRGWSETAWSGAGSGCSAFEPKPAWQTDGGCTHRTVADASAVADPNSGVAVYDSFAYHGSSGWMVFGGTSAASPIVAGFDALVGSAAATLSYPYDNASSFNDVTSGSNGSCGGTYLCTAKAGYDGPTGVGTPEGGSPTVVKPTVTTSVASAVVATTATVNGSVNPHGDATTYHFEYGTSTSYGTSTPDTSAGSGTSSAPATANLTGLAPSTTYHFRLVATNGGGTSNGSDLTFTTGAVPSVTTSAASPVVDTTATLNGTVNPNSLATTYHFEYGTTTSYGSSTPDTSAGSGTTGVAASAALTGLSPSTIYHFRLVATNGGGTTNGSDLTFTTGDKPTVTTSAASSVVDTTTILNGSVNPNRLATTYHFEYGTTTSYGSSTSSISAGSGTSGVAASAGVSGLAPSTTYHFRLVATNGAGTTNGSDLTFTTGDKPTVTTSAASTVVDTTATLNGTVNPNRLATTYHFDYGTTTSYGTSTPATSAGSGTSGVAASAGLTGLTPGTTYHFRLVATNAAGTTNGSDLTFTTGDKPSVTTSAASSVVDTTATLNGTVNPNRLATTYHFEYGTTTSYGSSTSSISAGSGSSSAAASAGLTGLAPSTTYHFRLVAANAAGTTTGSDLTFTTGAVPSVTTSAASSVADTTATLNGTVNPNRLATTYHFDYGTTTSYGSSTSDTSAGSGASGVAASAGLTGLTPSTTYHFRLVATNAGGTTTGSDLTLTTGDKPSVTTSAASSVIDTTATLNGSVNPNSLATTYHFEYGTTTSYGSSTPDTSAGSGTTGVAASAALTGLSPSTTYHFRLVATNGAGTTNGSDLTLTTGDKPTATTTAASSVIDTTATLNGSVNPNRLATTYHFEYGTTTSYGSSTSSMSAGSGTSGVAASAGVSGLAPSTTYHFRLVATNGAGTTNGSDLTLTTGDKPTATTTAASSVVDTTATLNGSVNPNRLATTYHFEYGTTTSYGTSTPDTSAGSGSSSAAASAGLTGLTPGTTYHFRVVATNTAGTTTGSDLTFTTGDKPSVTTTAASSVIDTTATLNGSVNPNSLATTYHFEYGTTTSYGTSTSTTSAGSGTSDAGATANLTGLTPGATYHFRLVATNAAGTTTGGDQMFTTLIKPTVTTGSATAVTTTTATLGGTVNPNASATTYRFEYGPTSSYGTQTAATDAGSGAGAVDASADLTGLTPGATYHFRLIATNAAGTTLGSDETLTMGDKPSATTDAASSVADTTATLNGSVNPDRLATTYRFEYGTTTSYGSLSPVADAGAGSSDQPVSTDLSALAPGTTYHFRVVATNDAGTVFGDDRTLTTSSPTGDTPPPTTTNDTPPPAQPVQTAPSLCVPKLSVPKQRRASVRRHGLRATVRCAPGATISASVILRRTGHRLQVVGRARRVVAANGTVKIVVRLSRRVRVALAHHQRLKLTLKVVITAGNGTRSTLRASPKLR